MLKIGSLIFVVSMIVTQTESLDSEICKLPTPQRHCIIESAARDRWPHTERYAFDWDQQKCILIRWADHCGEPPAGTNNFALERRCRDECSGWA